LIFNKFELFITEYSIRKEIKMMVLHSRTNPETGEGCIDFNTQLKLSLKIGYRNIPYVLKIDRKDWPFNFFLFFASSIVHFFIYYYHLI
jgi:hypothetical protein